MTVRIMGIDPGLQCTGWGVVEATGATGISFLAAGSVRTGSRMRLSDRLLKLYDGLASVISTWQPNEAAVERVFVNSNPASSLKLEQACTIALLVVAKSSLHCAEYAPNTIKQSIVGVGHAGKDQVRFMLQAMLPEMIQNVGKDSVDALATAICHARHARW